MCVIVIENNLPQFATHTRLRFLLLNVMVFNYSEKKEKKSYTVRRDNGSL